MSSESTIKLPHDLLLSVVNATVEASLGRDALLAGIPQHVRASLREVNSPREQFLTDLNRLLELGEIDHGIFPVRCWLENARSMMIVPHHRDIVDRALRILREGCRTTAAHFVTAYREAVRAGKDVWEGVLFDPSSHRRGSGTRSFTDAYHPLRIWDRRSGEVISDITGLVSLIARRPWLMVTGPGGSGKSTWQRWVFRELAHRDEYLPVRISLRSWRIARRDAPSGEGVLDRLITSCCEAHVRERGDQWVHVARGDGAPRLALLLDGWDELGTSAAETASDLAGLLHRYPFVAVILTGRDGSADHPVQQLRFAEYAMRALDRGEIHAFVARVQSASQRAGDSAMKHSLDMRWERAGALATPLLLTMMAPHFGQRPLPSKRHRAWQICIDQMLTAPDRREPAEATPAPHHYRPSSADERKYAVARLAWALHQRLDENSRADGLGGSWEELRDLLPREWPQEGSPLWTRELAPDGFLAWLTDEAGLLERTADGLAFAHSSFRDYLAAWYLLTTVENAESRREAFLRKAKHRHSWDMLSLWASMIEEIEPLGTVEIMRALAEKAHSNTRWLSGILLAQGLGDHATWERWLRRNPSFVEGQYSSEETTCARAWATCDDDHRRREFAARLSALATKERLLGRIHIERWIEEAQIKDRPELPPAGVARAVLAAMREGPSEQKHGPLPIRILAELNTTFNAFECAAELVLISTAWPSRRVMVARNLQLAIAAGAQRSDIVHLTRILATRPNIEDEVRRTLEQQHRSMGASAALGANGDIPDALMAGLFTNHFLHWQDNMVTLGGQWVARYKQGREPSGWKYARDATRATARILGESRRTASADRDDGALLRVLRATWDEILRGLFGFDSPRVWLRDVAVTLLVPHIQSSAVAVFLRGSPGSHACLIEAVRLHARAAPTTDLDAFVARLDESRTDRDPLWAALSRHMLNRSTAEDRAYLIERVARAGNGNALDRALGCVVRGDLLLNDGTESRLDDLLVEARVTPLPFLDPVAPPTEFEDADFENARLHRLAYEAGWRPLRELLRRWLKGKLGRDR